MRLVPSATEQAWGETWPFLAPRHREPPTPSIGTHTPRPLRYKPPPHPSLPREAYDPNFKGQKASEDLVVDYQYEKLGCPHLVYYNTPWKPVVEL